MVPDMCHATALLDLFNCKDKPSMIFKYAHLILWLQIAVQIQLILNEVLKVTSLFYRYTF